MNTLFSLRLRTAVLAVAVGTAFARLSAQDAPSTAPKPETAAVAATAGTDSQEAVVDLSSGTETAKAKTSRRKSGSRPGSTGDEVASVGKSETIAKGKTASELAVVAANGTVDGTVDGDAVVVGGSLYVNGHVKGDAVNVGFGVHLGPEAVVDGDVVGVGGGVFKAEGAKVGGDVIPIGISVLPFLEKGLPAWLSNYANEGLYKLRPLMFSTDAPWTIYGILFLLHFLVSALLPAASKGVEKTLLERPGATLLMAVLAIPLVLFALVLLSPTVLGPLAFIAAVLVAVLVGKVGILQFLGGRIAAVFAMPDLAPIARFLVGVVLATLLYATPYIGFFVWFSLSLWGFGAATLALFSRDGSAKAARTPTPAPEAPRAAPEGIRLATEVPGVPGGMAFAAASAATVSGTVAAEPPSIPGPEPVATTASTASTASTMPGPDAGPDAGPAPGTGRTESARPSFRDTSADWLRQTSMPGMAAAEIESLPRPTFLPRACALVIDSVVVAALLGFLSAFVPDSLMEGPGVFLTVGVAYHAALVAWRGASLGGLLFRFQVVRLDGRPLDRATALVRAASAILSTMCGVGWFWAFWDSERQTWHDKLAGTVVVQVPKVRPLV